MHREASNRRAWIEHGSETEVRTWWHRKFTEPVGVLMAWHGRGTLVARLMARSRHRRPRSVVATVCRSRRMNELRPEVFASWLAAAADVRL